MRAAYLKRTVASNNRAIFIIVYACLAAQLFNLFNLFVLSEVKLGSLNNRIYFSFYCTMIAACVLYLLGSHVWKNDIRRVSAMQYAGFTFWIAWCCLLNCYDIYRTPTNTSTAIFVTALFGSAVCIQISPLYSWVSYIIAGGIFLLQTFPFLDFGDRWNLVIGVAFVLIVSEAQFFFTMRDLKNQQIIRSINGQLMEEKEKLDVTFQKYNYVLEKTHNIILDWEPETDTAVFSKSWSELFGFPSIIPDFTQWLSNEAEQLPQDEQRQLLDILEACLQTTSEVETEFCLTDIHEEKHWYSLYFKFQKDSRGLRKSGLGYLKDISQHKKEIFRLKSSARTDALTGLLNRSGLYEYMKEHIEDKDTTVVMMILDIDNFKSINDTYGHPCGDQALIHMAQVLRKSFRTSDGIGRIGGDEFMVIFSFNHQNSLPEKKIQNLCSKPISFIWEGHEIPMHFTIGVAVHENEDFDSIYRKADSALYAAKLHNKGGYKIFTDDCEGLGHA